MANAVERRGAVDRRGQNQKELLRKARLFDSALVRVRETEMLGSTGCPSLNTILVSSRTQTEKEQ